MRRVVLLAACVALAGCMGSVKQAKVDPKPPPPPHKAVYTKDCYTVDLYTKIKVEKPPANVPERYKRFLGKWGGGAWNDVWCHDLLINRVYADGKVDLVDMHAPYAPWNEPPTAFRRTGWIDKEGKLHFVYGKQSATYQIVDGKMLGTRTFTGIGTLHIVLYRRGVPPVPIPRPARPFRVASEPKA